MSTPVCPCCGLALSRGARRCVACGAVRFGLADGPPRWTGRLAEALRQRLAGAAAIGALTASLGLILALAAALLATARPA
ncbi:MAG: hypothetical protein IT204_04165 [Fimbriimonadaceae bacterium]|nr:hypothetical protein [Fimbriimonadaceae bacterium]